MTSAVHSLATLLDHQEHQLRQTHIEGWIELSIEDLR
jgi:hypothetical protein